MVEAARVLLLLEKLVPKHSGETTSTGHVNTGTTTGTKGRYNRLNFTFRLKQLVATSQGN